MGKARSKWERHLPFIRESAGKLTRAEIAAAIGTTRGNLYTICYHFGIKLPDENHLRKRKPSKWLKALPLIREKAVTMPAAELAEVVGTSQKNLYNICVRYGISLARMTGEDDPLAEWHSRARLPDPFAGTKPRGGRYVGR